MKPFWEGNFYIILLKMVHSGIFLANDAPKTSRGPSSLPPLPHLLDGPGYVAKANPKAKAQNLV